MTKFLGIELVPLWVPIKRRIQMIFVIYWVSLFGAMPVLSTILLISLLFSQYYWITILYVSWIVYDVKVNKVSSRGGRRWEWFRNLGMWHYLKDYFPVTLKKTCDLDPSKNYIFGCHPHGIFACSILTNFGTNSTGFKELFPGITPTAFTLKFNFTFPILREFFLWHGGADVSKEGIQWVLTKQGTGNAGLIVIGGAEESLEANPGNYNVTLLHRKGFVKQAIRAGAYLVPVFSFGENDLFVQAENPVGSKLRNFQEKFKHILGFAPPLFHGRGVFNYTFGFLPYRRPVTTVVGRPIEVIKDSEPSIDLIDKYHKLYMEELSKLFDDNRKMCGIPDDVHLHIV